MFPHPRRELLMGSITHCQRTTFTGLLAVAAATLQVRLESLSTLCIPTRQQRSRGKGFQARCFRGDRPSVQHRSLGSNAREAETSGSKKSIRRVCGLPALASGDSSSRSGTYCASCRYQAKASRDGLFQQHFDPVKPCWDCGTAEVGSRQVALSSRSSMAKVSSRT